MRLTLRTLLAYMDDILDPADQVELGKKIESSDFASELIHRSRDTVRRLRLSAPDVMESHTDDPNHSGFDANLVAEYLDNTMAPEKVADFERTCLESDMHLAEVASCHHVLTMVLGEPVEINEAVRKQMYDLPEQIARGKQLRIEPAHLESQRQSAQQAEIEQGPLSATLSTAIPKTAGVEIPDYLQEAARSKRRSRRWLIAAVLLICGVGYIAYWESVEQELPSGLAGVDPESLSSDPVISGPADSSLTTGSSDTGSSAIGPVTSTAEVDPDSEAAPFVPGSAAPDSPEIIPESSDKTGTKEMLDGDEGYLPEVNVPEVEMPIPSPQEGDPNSISDTEESDTTEETTKTQADNLLSNNQGLLSNNRGAPPIIPETAESSESTESNIGEPMHDASAGEAVGDKIGTDDSPEATAEPAELKPVRLTSIRLGNYLGTDDVLLRRDSERNAWVRVSPRSELNTGERLLTLPKFRSPMVLAGLHVSLSGGTQVLLPIDAGSFGAGLLENPSGDEKTEVAMEIVFGRVLFNAALRGNHLVLIIDDQVHRIHLGDSASLAVEVNRKYVPGYDAEEVAAPIIATWYLTSGTLQCTSENEMLSIEAPATWQMEDLLEHSPKLIEQLPPWIDREPVTATERLALTVLDKELAPGEPVEIRLLELNDPQQRGRRQEVRTLAAQSSVYVGEFEPFVKALRDVHQKAAWKAHIDTLRQAMVLSPDAASSIREAFVTLRGENAANDLMQMVIGYDSQSIGTTPEEVRNGAMSQLIRWLDNDSLDYRVLAYHNLHEITGKSIGGYRPTYNSSQRQRALRIWQNRLESGELVGRRR